MQWKYWAICHIIIELAIFIVSSNRNWRRYPTVHHSVNALHLRWLVVIFMCMFATKSYWMTEVWSVCKTNYYHYWYNDQQRCARFLLCDCSRSTLMIACSVDGGRRTAANVKCLKQFNKYIWFNGANNKKIYKYLCLTFERKRGCQPQPPHKNPLRP